MLPIIYLLFMAEICQKYGINIHMFEKYVIELNFLEYKNESLNRKVELDNLNMPITI